jgi:Raf kinase inhibitor-like YbhB/YbcL family protein
MKPSNGFLVMISIIGLLYGSGCQAAPAAHGGTVMPIQITSSAFKDGETIPAKYTCDGANVSPPLAWSGVPGGTHSLAVIADDPDAPVGTWVHWVLYNLPAGQTSLVEGVQGVGLQGTNDFRKIGYGGPCPPRGKPHRYFFKLYALDSTADIKPGGSKADLEKAMQGHILAQGQLMGRYGR